MSRLELLNSRGFKDEKHLSEFLKNCPDETWKKELMDFFGKDEVEEVIETTPEEITEEVEKELAEEFPEIEENKED